MSAPDFNHVLAPEYLDGLRSCPIEEVRRRRTECQQLEAVTSYQRRLAQGRLDIVLADVDRRASGRDAAQLPDLVERLPEILADRRRGSGGPPGNGSSGASAGGSSGGGSGGRGSSGGRMAAVTPLSDPDPALELELGAIVGADVLGSLPERSDAEVQGIATALLQYEQSLSGRRRQLHERIDALQHEIVRRYRDGEADVDSLLA